MHKFRRLIAVCLIPLFVLGGYTQRANAVVPLLVGAAIGAEMSPLVAAVGTMVIGAAIGLLGIQAINKTTGEARTIYLLPGSAVPAPSIPAPDAIAGERKAVVYISGGASGFADLAAGCNALAAGSSVQSGSGWTENGLLTGVACRMDGGNGQYMGQAFQEYQYVCASGYSRAYKWSDGSVTRSFHNGDSSVDYCLRNGVDSALASSAPVPLVMNQNGQSTDPASSDALAGVDIPGFDLSKDVLFSDNKPDANGVQHFYKVTRNPAGGINMSDVFPESSTAARSTSVSTDSAGKLTKSTSTSIPITAANASTVMASEASSATADTPTNAASSAGTGTGSGSIVFPTDYARQADAASAAASLTKISSAFDTATPDVLTVPTWTDPFGSTFGGLLSWRLPAHSSSCPTPSFPWFGDQKTFDGHCRLFSDNAGTISVVMVAVWVVKALVIVLLA